MYAAHLSLHDFRSWPTLEIDLEPGATAFIGSNGQGKTNVVEALDYLSRLSSHRVSSDLPLIRRDTEQAVIRAAIVREGRTATLEIAILAGKSNRAKINRGPLPRARDLLGLVRTVVFAPDDLALVKGDPSERRRFADDLRILQGPRFAAVRSDYDRVLKQRNTLLKTARTRGLDESGHLTLEIWDQNLAKYGAEIMAARHQLTQHLDPLLGKAYEAVARGATRDDANIKYKPSFETEATTQSELEEALLEQITARRKDELARGVSLVGPHRDDLICWLGDFPVKGYASHGEGWSFALAMRLASYDLLRADGDDPILVLDDVFAELDSGRRTQLADYVADAEQVLITAAVAEDIPESLRGRRMLVADGQVVQENQCS